jgi:hypothetical protein
VKVFSLLAVTLAALGTSTDWHTLQFRNIPPIQNSMQGGKITLDVKGTDGRYMMRVHLPETLELVGLWLMADDDDSGPAFTREVDSIKRIAP